MNQPAAQDKNIPNSGRKLFFGLFVFPLIIAVGMIVLICAVVVMTGENETPETLIAAIKTAPPDKKLSKALGIADKKWQKAYELSNELNSGALINQTAVMGEIIQILHDPEHYDSETRSYMALALGYFKRPEAIAALRKALRDSDLKVRMQASWALGSAGVTEAIPDILLLLKSTAEDERETAAYVLGAMGERKSTVHLRPLLADPDRDVRWNTALALARLGDSAGSKILVEMLDRGDLENNLKMSEPAIEAAMINASKGLALIQNEESVRILESVSRKDKNLRVRQAAMNAAREIAI